MDYLEKIKNLNNLSKMADFIINERNNLKENIKNELFFEFKKCFNLSNNITISYYLDLNFSEMSKSDEFIFPKMNIRGFLDNLDNTIFILLNNSFIWYKNATIFDGDIYKTNIIENKEALFTANEYFQIVKSFENTFKVKINTSIYSLKTEVNDIRSFLDLKILYPNAECLGRGDIWHKGWDIPDIWYLIKNNNEILFYYSDDGHSKCMTNFISGKENIINFIKKYDDDVQKEILNIFKI